jgi:hypothetical protein
MGKTIPNDPQNNPNGHEIYQMAVKYTNIFHLNDLKNIPRLVFWGYEKNLATLVAHGRKTFFSGDFFSRRFWKWQKCKLVSDTIHSHGAPCANV